MAKLNRKGVTLVELLGAIVISSIGISLVAMAITLIVRATNDTMMNNRANTTGMIISQSLKHVLDDFIATDIRTCDATPTSDCFILQKYYERTLHPDTQQIKDIPVDGGPEEIRIEKKNNGSGQLDLFMNNVSVYDIYSLQDSPFRYTSITFTYDPLFGSINSTPPGTYVMLSIRFVIQDTNNRNYQFSYTYTFRARDMQ